LNKIAFGFLIAPLVTTAVAVSVALARTDYPPNFGTFEGFEEIGWSAIFVLLLCYFSELLFGWPLVVLFRRCRWVLFWHFVMMGVACAAVLAMLIAYLMFPSRGVSLGAGMIGTLRTFIPFGAINGAALWWLVIRQSGARSGAGALIQAETLPYI
jgi:hypothetical protein